MSEFLKLPRYPELLVRRQARACGLLAIPEGGVKDDDFVVACYVRFRHF